MLGIIMSRTVIFLNNLNNSRYNSKFIKKYITLTAESAVKAYRKNINFVRTDSNHRLI